MKLQEKLPLPLKKIVDDLDEMEVEGIVTSAKVEYDDSIIGTDIYLTLKVSVTDIYNERRKNADEKFDDAMTVL